MQETLRVALGAGGEVEVEDSVRVVVDALEAVVVASGAENILFASSVLSADIAAGLSARLDAGLAQGEDAGGDAGVDAALKGEISRFSMSTVCDKRELFWRRRLSSFRIAEAARILWRNAGGRNDR